MENVFAMKVFMITDLVKIVFNVIIKYVLLVLNNRTIVLNIVIKIVKNAIMKVCA